MKENIYVTPLLAIKNLVVWTPLFMCLFDFNSNKVKKKIMKENIFVIY